MKNRKGFKIITGVLVLYALLLILLTTVESRASGSMIKSLGDALWYSIITITTVGYGDMSPVTAAGKIIGVVFALCSVGLLTIMITYCISLIGDDVVPRFRLRHNRKSKWYWFSSDGSESRTLAQAILESEPDSLIIIRGIFGSMGHNFLRMDTDPEELVRIRGKAEGIDFFYTGDDQWRNVSSAVCACDFGAPVYCLSDYAEDNIPDNLRLFSRSDALSRSYWKNYPLNEEERCVVIIGCSDTGSEILKRALLTNVYDKTRTIDYHIYGEHCEFVALHPEIINALRPENTAEDSLYFHDVEWTANPDILSSADRIIICTDDDTENLNIYSHMRQWFAVDANIHVRLNQKVAGITCFGSNEDIMKPEYVMKDTVDRIAIELNDIYNRNSSQPVSWSDLGEFLRQSNIAAADHLPIKMSWLLGEGWEFTTENCRRAYEKFCTLDQKELDTCREMEHRRWMRFYWMYNWKPAEKKNNTLRLHTDLLPYDQLPEDERRKDDYAWEMLGQISWDDKSII